MADESGRQGVSPGRRACGARDGAWLQGPFVGLQRPESRAHHRSGGRRSRSHFCDQQAARAHQHPLAWTAFAQWHGRCGGIEPARNPVGQDLRLRVRRTPARHVHVPPACGRDGTDGHGHDGLLGHAPEGQASLDRRGAERLLLPAERLRHRAWRCDPQGCRDDELQSVDMEQPCLSWHRLLERPAQRQGAYSHRQPHHDQPPDALARSRVFGHRHGWWSYTQEHPSL